MSSISLVGEVDVSNALCSECEPEVAAREEAVMLLQRVNNRKEEAREAFRLYGEPRSFLSICMAERQAEGLPPRVAASGALCFLLSKAQKQLLRRHTCHLLS